VSLLAIFATAILPIVTIAATGFVLGHLRDVDAGPLNTVTVYVLAPALVFHSLATTDLGAETLLGIGLGVVCFTAVMTLLAETVGRSLDETEPLLGAFVLVSVFANTGNYGIPISEFAFGSVGRSTAVVYLVVQSVAMYTLGVYLAARGSSSDPRGGVRAVFTIPLVYAVAAALAARALGVLPPAGSALMETTGLVGDSAIPVMLLILGLELADTDWGVAALRVLPAVGLRMLVAPVVGVCVVVLVGSVVDLGPTVARVFVLECAMPAAVTPLILTGEFADEPADDLDPVAYTSTTVLVSTLLSIPLLTGLVALLEAGLIV
jgi:predicted permease